VIESFHGRIFDPADGSVPLGMTNLLGRGSANDRLSFSQDRTAAERKVPRP